MGKINIDSEIITLKSDQEYRKSNMIINARGRASITSQRLFAIAMKYAEYDEETNSVIAVIPARDIRQYFGGKDSKAVYETIANSTIKDPSGRRQSLLDWRIVAKDDEKRSFIAMNVIQTAAYENAILHIQFNSSLTKHLIGMKSNYTILNLEDTANFQSAYSFRLYEMAKAQLDFMRSVNKRTSGKVQWKIHLIEFQYRMGVLNPEETPEISREMKKDKPDYNKVLELVKENKSWRYKTFSSFRVRVLDRAVTEVNEGSPLSIRYDTIKGGRGAKVQILVFYIDDDKSDSNGVVNLGENVEVERKDIDIQSVLIDTAMMLSSHRLSSEDVKNIVIAADYDIDRIKKAYEVATNTHEISNFVGFMISAIRNNYEIPISVVNKKKNSFNNFEERSYDYGGLERKLRKN